ncbi:hypothetical protein QQ045_032663 [Rhodiola kirilowii]
MESKRTFVGFFLVLVLLVSSQVSLATTFDEPHVVMRDARELCTRNPDHQSCHNNRRRSAAAKEGGATFGVACSSVIIAAAMLAL